MALTSARCFLEMKAIGLTGAVGPLGDDPDLCDICIRAPSPYTPIIQQCHIVIGHIICDLVEREMFP